MKQKVSSKQPKPADEKKITASPARAKRYPKRIGYHGTHEEKELNAEE